MLIVHHLDNSRSQRILWCLEELGLPYEICFHKRDPVTHLAPQSLKDVHPLGRAPVLEIDGEKLLESGAILETLAEGYGDGVLLPLPQWRRDYRFWMHYAEGSAMPTLVMALIFRMIPRQPMPFFVRPIAKGLCQSVLGKLLQPQLDTQFRYIDDHLAQLPWFAGLKFSAADIQMSFPCQAIATRGSESYPHIASFVQKIEARPAYQAALAKGGPFEMLG